MVTRSIMAWFRMQYNVILHPSIGNLNVNKEWNITIYLIMDLVANHLIKFNTIEYHLFAQYY